MPPIPRSCYAAIVAACCVLLPSQQLPADERMTAYAVRGTVAVDGEIDGVWRQVVPVRVQRPVPLSSSSTESTVSATVRMMWDDDTLYLLWHVQDRHVSYQNDLPWQQDSVEVMLDENGHRSPEYEADDAQWRVSVQGEISGNGPAFGGERIRAVTRLVSHGYLVEQSIRWSTVPPKTNVAYGVELQINDDPGSGRRESIVKWNDINDDAWRDTSRFGTLRLVATGADVPALLRVGGSPALPTPAELATVTRTLPSATADESVPNWVRSAVFYQIFPERFRNGDPGNDPTRDSLEVPERVPQQWRLSPWTGDWYARDRWEAIMGPTFYEHGVYDRRFGGDLQGIQDKLDYLTNLGISALYLNPVFYARSLHKYDAASMHHIDPFFGPDPQGDLRQLQGETSDPRTWRWTAADRMFLTLIQESHRRGLRIVIDGVFNHTGRAFFAFADIRARRQQSGYLDWYDIESFDDPTTSADEFRYRCWQAIESLPEFATSADGDDLAIGPKDYIFAITRRWMDPNGDGDPADGIDGWRLDVAPDVPDGFWPKWHALVRGINPQAYTAAEIWTDAACYLDRCHFSGSMNYHAFAFPVKGFLIDGTASAPEFARELDRRRQELPPSRQGAMLNLLDSHDTDRVASMIVNGGRHPYVLPARFDYDVSERVSPRRFRDYDVRRPNEQQRQIQRLAVLWQMTYIGAPMIYYGSEAGMWGGDDPDDRMPMIWDDRTYEPQAAHPLPGRTRPVDPVTFDRGLHDDYRRLIALRGSLPALQDGTFRVLAAEADQPWIAFERATPQQCVVVVINRGGTPMNWTIDYRPSTSAEVSGVVAGTAGSDRAERFRSTYDGQRLTVELPPWSGVVLR